MYRRGFPTAFKQTVLFAALSTGCAGASPATQPSAQGDGAEHASAPPAAAEDEAGAPRPPDPAQAASPSDAAAGEASSGEASSGEASSGEPGELASGSATPAERAPSAAAPPPPPAGTKVLHVGDSFAGALGIPLGKLLEGAGVRSVLKHKDSSYLTTWAWEPDLAREIWRYNPDLVVVTLGANELAIADPAQREKTVRKIVDTIGKRPCLWIAIPLWSERNNGLLDVIRSSVSPCIYYDTNQRLDTLHMPRIHDGIHPTQEARRAWAEAVFDYLLTHRQPEERAPWRLVDDPPPEK